MDSKPLGMKSYGSIAHLPNSRLGPGDHYCNIGQARIATEKARDRHDLIVVQEKLDGSNVAVYRQGNEIIPISRSGYVANTSPYEHHHRFYDWALKRSALFLSILEDGERICGEWMAMAHGTLYRSLTAPFYAFDIMCGHRREPYPVFWERLKNCELSIVPLVCGGPISVEKALDLLSNTFDALEGPEGLVYRVHRRGEVDFLVKWVKPNKVDGKYLPEISGKDPVWMWED